MLKNAEIPNQYKNIGCFSVVSSAFFAHHLDPDGEG